MTRALTKVTSRREKRKSNQKSTIEFLEKTISANGVAMADGPLKKKWTIHDIRSIRPLTPAQEDFFRSFFTGNNIFAYGTAGTGKSYVAIYLALAELFRENSKQNRLIIVRSAVATRDIGFMPGTLEEKISYYENPYRDIISDIVGKTTAYDHMKNSGIIEFVTTSYVRGISWNNAIVVFDEAQNATSQEIHSVVTRLGKNSKIMILGDIAQNDLNKRKNDVSGMMWALRVVEKMSEFDAIQFTVDDVVRSSFVKAWIAACETVATYI